MNKDCSCNDCEQKNKRISVLKKKLAVYEDLINEIKEEEELIDQKENKYSKNHDPTSRITNLTESIIVEVDDHGRSDKKLKSDLSESFLIVEDQKDIESLPKEEQNALNEYRNFQKYDATVGYMNEGITVYKTTRFFLDMARFFAPLF